MKLYKEMLRKLAVVGLPLLAITMVYTLVKGGTDCFGSYYILESTSAISQIPVLRYYVFTAIFFAVYGFSFQFSRAGSDVYHSLPVNRTDLYLSVLLATATWMGATILINELEMLFIYLVSGCPFVPVYILLSTLYYFVAAMMVFAAAAIGCAVSGTIITALASTGIVLLLPRYVQFLFTRGVVERVPIIGWLDFGGWLNPSTNAATGILTMHLRQVFNGYLITLPHILYSLLPLLVMLAAGWWLFKSRPSEIAQKNGGHHIWTVATAVLLSFAVLLPITMNHQKLFSTYGFILTVAALGVFIVYQIIVSTKVKKALKTLPFFLIAVLAVLGVSGLINTVSDSMLNTTPEVSEIESVTFPGFDRKNGTMSYNSLLTQDIVFTDDETKAYVAEALRDAVDELQAEPDYSYYEYNRFEVIEPVVIKLSGGGTIRRTIEFDNIDDLNALRMKNEEFADALRAFPPVNSIQYLSVNNDFTLEEEQAILESYIEEATRKNLLSGYYYRDRTMDMLPNGDYITQGENQNLTGISTGGHTGSKRYDDSYSVRLTTPDTASLLMRTYNAYITGDPVAELNEKIELFDKGLAGDDDNLSFNISIYNYENEDGLIVQDGTNFYINNYMLEDTDEYNTNRMEYMRKFADSLSNTELTDSTEGVFIRLSWSYRYEGMEDDDKDYSRPTSYIRFANETDEQAFLTMFEEWESAQRMY